MIRHQRYSPTRTLLLLTLLLLLPVSSFSKLAEVDIPKTVAKHDYAVVGELVNVNKSAGWAVIHGSGTIKVSTVIYGNLTHNDELPITWTIYPAIIPDMDISEWYHGPAIWFFNLQDGVVSERNSLHISKLPEVQKALKNPVRLRSAKVSGSPFRFKIGYMNITSETITVPNFKVENNRLFLPAAATIEATDHLGTVPAVPQLPGAVTHLVTITSRTLEPGQSYFEQVNLEDLFAYAGDTIEVEWKVPGLGESHDLWLSPPSEDDGWLADYQAQTPLWFKLGLLVRYSPTREVIIGIVLLIITVSIYVLHRRQTVQ